ncbi:unnamed protein product [Phytomonas sp. Hart1]|nr:unnamed protein product [Phytomonas sp. Hart1]|eukprot:CCW68092.1 unnamed protein product [Phytomonas sp. isolate Hart1]
MTRCSACNIVLTSTDALRSHYNSEAHILNVGRRVEGLRPLSHQELRSTGVLNSHKDSALDSEDGPPLFSCTLCKKSFHCVQTLQAHVRSTAHLMLKEQHILARDSEAASMLTSTSLGSAAMGLHRRHHAKRAALRRLAQEVAGKAKYHPKVTPEDREKDVDESRCFLCGYLSPDSVENVGHLQKIHNFFIPMQPHCQDVDGLLGYLSRKVNGLVCLVCNEKTRSFASLSALRDHMRESDHEKILLGPEYQEFYSCSLEDPNSGPPSVLNTAQCGQIVLVNNEDNREGGKKKKRILLKREADVPHPRPREAAEETEQRRMILASKHEEMALAKKEYHELAAMQERQDAKTLKQSEGDFKKHQLRVNQRSNKLHPKGYDGEGKLN